MAELKRRILENGAVLPGGVLRVDSFLNQQIDMKLMRDIGAAFAARFHLFHPDIVLTIESSGIVPAGQAALALEVPLVICKKQASRITQAELYETNVQSFTKGTSYELSVSKAFLMPGARVLFIDDFLAMGEAALGACRLIEQAGASLAGIGIVIEKTFQPGRSKLDSLGRPIFSLARISSMSEAGITWAE
ncbi:MAG: xanthine phosphoribosyltransferase [Oscillospiraceae bacterium]|nr:xanthine phosphoribosyltransferase [Oscillospiraceae bacterium]